jgi:hypothetical protein
MAGGEELGRHDRVCIGITNIFFAATSIRNSTMLASEAL